MKKLFAVKAVLALLGLNIAAQANITIDTVFVGDAGNASDTRYSDVLTGSHSGAVDYNYNIGKYEVTAAQYTDFLNAKAKTDPYGLYINFMHYDVLGRCNILRSGQSGSYSYSVASDWANRPVTRVSFWDACRFANWLGNGQGDGDTETGAYTLNGYTGTDGRTIQRNAGWTCAVTSEDEWYKAAYYKGGGTNAGYWDYATQSNTTPGRDLADTSGNNANYHGLDGSFYGPEGSPYFATEVGEFQNSVSAYGTFDQCGNVVEWTETVVQGTIRGQRGGSFNWGETILKADWRQIPGPDFELGDAGFRIVQAVPEPSSIFALAGGLVGLLSIRRRRA